MQHFRPQDSVALLIDGENLSAAHAPAIRELAEREGARQVARIYGDAARIGAWSALPGGVLMHTVPGKNAADIALSIAAVHLLHMTPIRRFVLASSDGDLAQAAIHLREWGAQVTGIGDTRAPRMFRHACHAFHELGAVEKHEGRPQATKPARPANDGPLVLWDAVTKAISASPDGAISILDLEAGLRRIRPDFEIERHPDKCWQAYFLKRAGLFAYDPQGPQARVRLAAPPQQAHEKGRPESRPVVRAVE